jgi:hypothetical protein
MVAHAFTNAVMAEALHEVGPGCGVEVVAGCQARCRLSDFVFCGRGDTSLRSTTVERSANRSRS